MAEIQSQQWADSGQPHFSKPAVQNERLTFELGVVACGEVRAREHARAATRLLRIVTTKDLVRDMRQLKLAAVTTIYPAIRIW